MKLFNGDFSRKMSIVFLCFIFLFKDFVSTWRTEEGYPRGLMAICPGSTKPAEIPRSQLHHLFFVVQGNGRTREKYTYWDAKNIATDPRIDFKRKTIVVANGYLDSAHFPIATLFSNLYEDQNYNVILIDNQRFVTVHFFLATRLIRAVGKHVAEVLAQLTEAGLDPGKVELLGYSLGGQIVSFIASNFQKITGRNISRITGLDPTGPCFRTLGPGDRLDASNADFVQVVHANIEGFGMANRMGHVDFYLNGGEYQPSNLNFYDCLTACSHFRLLPLWLSVMRNRDKFIGIKCDSIQQARDAQCYDRRPIETNVLGPNVDTTKHGIFYLSTSIGFPYYLGEDGLKPEFAAWRRISDINDGNQFEIYT